MDIAQPPTLQERTAAPYLFERYRRTTERPVDELEEIVSLVVDDDKRRKVAPLDLPDGFHSEFGVLDPLPLGDAVLCETRRRPADRAEVEAAVCLAGLGDLAA